MGRKREIVIVSGLRTPLGKAGGKLASLHAVDLGVQTIRDLLAHSPVSAKVLDQMIIGNVIQPAEAANVARVIGIRSGIPRTVPAHTVHRNCASGMQAVTDAAEKIRLGIAEVVLAGGVESMSHAPFLFHDNMRLAITEMQRAKTAPDRLTALKSIFKSTWKPRIALLEGLTDPTVHLNMGQTAEVLAREFHISRREQNAFAMESHGRAASSWKDGWFNDEVMHLFSPPDYKPVHMDEGIRPQQSMEALARLKPIFDRPLGSVTAGNSSQISDGAAMLIVTHRQKAESEGWPVLGYVHDWAYAGCDPARMGLGPVYASHHLLTRAGLAITDIERFEINEAFAAQVLAVMKAMDSKYFAGKYLGLSESLSAPDPDKVNVHGGAIAMGHPVGMSGARLILTLLRQLKHDTSGGLGLASLCVGGGQGGAVLLGSEPWKS